MIENRIANRIAEDSVGATVGAATGVDVSALVGLALPALSAIVPLGLVAGSIIGIIFKEIAQRRQKQSSEEHKP